MTHIQNQTGIGDRACCFRDIDHIRFLQAPTLAILHMQTSLVTNQTMKRGQRLGHSDKVIALVDRQSVGAGELDQEQPHVGNDFR